jgi:MoaA/NifB/PqqE/SkfB family radical SAM enzyme
MIALIKKAIKLARGNKHHINLLESSFTRIAHVEFTSRCNLRCVYCGVSQPQYKSADLDEETIKKTIAILKKRNINVVCVNGHGETTIYKDWHRHCNQLLEAGTSLHIISNFAKEFSNEELKTLSRFKSIEISCDTCDPQLFKQLRRGADLKTICLNILRLRAMCTKNRSRAPSISFSCVVSDQNIFQLPDYVLFGKTLGVNYFNFCNLSKYPDLEGIPNPKHISQLPAELLIKAEESLTKTFSLLQREKIDFHTQQGLLDTLKMKIQSLNTNPVPSCSKKDHPDYDNDNHAQPLDSKDDESCSPLRRYSSSPGEAQTRDCLDPWQFIMVRANNDVHPCCWHQPIYSLSKKQSLADVFNSTPMKQLRRQLLTGNLSNDCLHCPGRGETSINQLRKKVRDYLKPGIYKFLSPGIPDIKEDILRDFDVVYEQGWYSPETNSTIKDPDWQTWRWTSKQALCKLENPKRKALLILRGSVDKSIYRDQSVFIKLNGILLDEFLPGTAKFFKEYVITKDMMKDNDEITLIIETDKTFIPSERDSKSRDNRELGIQVYQLFFGENFV